MTDSDDSGIVELDRRRFVQATGVGVAGLAAGGVPIAQGNYEASWDDPDDVLKVLYLGGVEDGAPHYSEVLVQEITEYFLQRGIVAHYTERQDDLNPETLSNYDAVMLYGNRLEATEDQIDALEEFVEDGGGFVPVHSASASFTGDFGDTPDDLAERYISLVGGAFDYHSDGEMTTDRVDHEIFDGVDEIEAHEETYRHYDIADDIEVLATGAGADYEEDEEAPFTWIREQGDGRVFYTAWGHGIFEEIEAYGEAQGQMNVWVEDGFKQLLENGIRWASGNEDTIGEGNHPMLEDLEYTDIEEYGHDEVPYYHDNDVPERVSTDDGETWDLVQDPLDVSDSLTHTIAPAEFEMEYFVSEETLPDGVEGQILDMTFDAAGRCWITVTQDYPNDAGDGNDQIVICEDTDDDGIADDFTVFADGLSIPHSIIAYKDGVLVAEVRGFDTTGRVVYLGDEDGDGEADVEETIFEGVGTDDTHAGLNQIWYGHDNWVYGVVGYSGLTPDIDEELELNQDLFRFKPDGSEIEYVGGGASNMAGVKSNEEGLVFCSSATAGNNVTSYAAIPANYYDYINGFDGYTTVDIRGQNHSRINWENRILPVNDRYRMVEQIGGFTAVTDQEFYTAREFPEQYWNSTIFTGEGCGQLLATHYVEQDGAGYEAINHNNLVASNDEWFSPTYANTGPDGMVWMIDLYNFVFQHNPTPDGYENGPGNAYETNVREEGKAFSRLYRVTTGEDVDLHPMDLSDADPEELVDALSSDVMFWRLTAQRKLVERGETDVVDDLIELVGEAEIDDIGLAPAAIHAIWTLDGLGVLEEVEQTLTHAKPDDVEGVDDDVDHVIFCEDDEDSEGDAEALEAVREALMHDSAGVRLNAVRVFPGSDATQEAILDADLLNDDDWRVVQWAFLKLAETPESDDVGAAIFDAIDDEDRMDDDLLVDAASVGAATHAQGFIDAYEAEYDDSDDDSDDDEEEEGDNILENPSFEDVESSAGPDGWETNPWAGDGEFTYTDEEAYEGDYSIRIDSEDGIDGAWFRTVEVEPDTEYTLSGMVKAEGVDAGSGYGAGFNVHQLGEESIVGEVTGDTDWTEVSGTFDSGDNEELQINALMGGFGESSGTAWWDNVSFENPDGENLLSNGGFEEGSTTSAPEAWSTDTWGGSVEHGHTDEEANDGDYSVRLHSEDGADAAWSTTAEVEPNSTYRISAYAKTEDVDEGSGFGALIGIGGLTHLDAIDQRTDALTGTNDEWTEISWEFETQNTSNINVHAMIGWHGSSSGTIWYDDLSLVQIGQPADGIDLVYDRVVAHLDDDDDGDDTSEGAIEPGTAIEFDGEAAGWVGIAPDSIEDEENPTLTLVEGETYEIGWSEGDGNEHNIAIRDEDEEVVDELVTEATAEPDDDQWLEFEASAEMVEYVCEPHQGAMVGEIDIVEE